MRVCEYESLQPWRRIIRWSHNKCERERGDDVMLTSSVRCGSFRHAIGTILRPVTSVGDETRYRRVRRGFLTGELRLVVTLLSLNPLLATPGAQRSQCLQGRP